MNEDIILTIKWTTEDLKNALEDRGLNPTDENIGALLENGLIEKLEDGSIEKGWDIIDYICSICRDQLE